MKTFNTLSTVARDYKMMLDMQVLGHCRGCKDVKMGK